MGSLHGTPPARWALDYTLARGAPSTSQLVKKNFGKHLFEIVGQNIAVANLLLEAAGFSLQMVHNRQRGVQKLSGEGPQTSASGFLPWALMVKCFAGSTLRKMQPLPSKLFDQGIWGWGTNAYDHVYVLPTYSK